MSSYSQYRTFDEIIALTRDDDSRAEVIAWLKHECGATNVKVSRALDWISASAPAKKVEACLRTTLSTFVPASAAVPDQSIVRATAYEVPLRLASKITTISSLTRFPDLTVKRKATQQFGDSTNVTTPTLLSSFYSIDLTPVPNGGAATQAVYEQGQSFIAGDLRAFQARYNTTAVVLYRR